MHKYDDNYWMQQALVLAQQAEQLNEVPVGAIVVKDDEMIGRGFNQPIQLSDPTAHAEIQALRDAATTIGNYRLVGARLYVTLEPCMMCAGAIVHSRIDEVIFGAREPKAGAVVSQSQYFDTTYLNHQVAYRGDVCAQDCSDIVSQFFTRRRSEHKARKAYKKE